MSFEVRDIARSGRNDVPHSPKRSEPLWQKLRKPSFMTLVPPSVQDAALQHSSLALRAASRPTRATFRDFARFCSLLSAYVDKGGVHHHKSKAVDAIAPRHDMVRKTPSAPITASFASGEGESSSGTPRSGFINTPSAALSEEIPMPSVSMHVMCHRSMEGNGEVLSAVKKVFRTLASPVPNSSADPSTANIVVGVSRRAFKRFIYLFTDGVGGDALGEAKAPEPNFAPAIHLPDIHASSSADPDTEADAVHRTANAGAAMERKEKYLKSIVEGEWLAMRVPAKGSAEGGHLLEAQFVRRLIDIVLLANVDGFAYVTPIVASVLHFLRGPVMRWAQQTLAEEGHHRSNKLPSSEEVSSALVLVGDQANEVVAGDAGAPRDSAAAVVPHTPGGLLPARRPMQSRKGKRESHGSRNLVSGGTFSSSGTVANSASDLLPSVRNWLMSTEDDNSAKVSTEGSTMGLRPMQQLDGVKDGERVDPRVLRAKLRTLASSQSPRKPGNENSARARGGERAGEMMATVLSRERTALGRRIRLAEMFPVAPGGSSAHFQFDQ